MHARLACMTFLAALCGCSSTTAATDASSDLSAPLDLAVDLGGPEVSVDISAPDAPDVPGVPDGPGAFDVAGDGARTDSPVAPDAPDAPDARSDVAPGACDAGTTACLVAGTPACFDLMTDRGHCGTCDTVCCEGTPCIGGRCSFGCTPGSIRCGCACVNPTVDANNCGACGNVCAPGQVCTAGRCVVAGCGGPATCPAGMCVCMGVCRDFRTDSSSCGACGHACGFSEVCMAGVCTPFGDAGVRDATVSDAGRCAAVTEPPAPSGVCDGRGRILCQMWAAAMTDGGTAYATCVATPAGCLRADACDDINDPATCHCGGGPLCAPGQVCRSTGTGAPSCQCIRSE